MMLYSIITCLVKNLEHHIAFGNIFLQPLWNRNFVKSVIITFKEDIGTMLGNLTCVLTKMNMLDSSLQVNLKLWTTDIWQQLNLKKTLAGEDPEWRQKLIGGYTDCYQVASNWPQQSLDRNPITKVFGRHMIFFKCAMVSWDPKYDEI